eukprot:s1952_g15.t1
MVSTARPTVTKGDQFRTDAKCTDNLVVLAGWELETRRWFSLRVTSVEAPYFFKSSVKSQWASASAELLASLLALHAFGWLKESRHRKAVELSLAGGTDNRANESLASKRATMKWPLMPINMQLSAHLEGARLALSLRWRPRDENVEADDLTNERFDGFDSEKRIMVSLADWISLLETIGGCGTGCCGHPAEGPDRLAASAVQTGTATPKAMMLE